MIITITSLFKYNYIQIIFIIIFFLNTLSHAHRTSKGYSSCSQNKNTFPKRTKTRKKIHITTNTRTEIYCRIGLVTKQG